MGRSLRILHTADSHIGAELPACRRLRGRRRGDDLVDSFERALSAAAEDGIDLVIHAGDLFDQPQPSARALAAAGGPILELAAAGVPVVIVPGNHERSSIPSTLLLSHANIHVVREPCTLTFRINALRVAVAAIPCLRRYASKRFPAALASTGWIRARGDVRILAVHQTFASASCGPGGFRFRRGDHVLQCDAVPAGFDYVAAGHIHRHQVLAPAKPGRPSVVYCGSPDRVTFAEIDEPKGFVRVEENRGRLIPTFVEHDVRPMSVWPVDVTGLSRRALADHVAGIVAALEPHAMAQVRFSGGCAPATMRDLKLSATARAQRPDVLFSVSAAAVEFLDDAAKSATACRGRSTFACLDAPVAETLVVSAEDVASLPRARGVYALLDRGGRLLYVGKSRNIRARVRTHIRARRAPNAFGCWGRQIARVEARTADSELEALLVEAEVIRILRPPFNRRMRRWWRYCYLRESGSGFGPLEVCAEPVGCGRCFGPFRSRRQAEVARDVVCAHFGLASYSDDGRVYRACVPDGMGAGPAPPGAARDRSVCGCVHDRLCCGVCSDGAHSEDYARRVRLRDRVLDGSDDQCIRALEDRSLDDSRRCRQNDGDGGPARRAWVLRQVFDHCATVRDAERLLGGTVLMPGVDGRVKTARFTREGVRFDVVSADTVAVWLRRDGRGAPAHRRRMRPGGRLPKSLVDGLCVVVRALRQTPNPYRFISVPPIEVARGTATRGNPQRTFRVCAATTNRGKQAASPYG